MNAEIDDISIDDSELEDSRQLKTKLINALVQEAGDRIVPADREDRKFLLDLIESRERVAISKRKLKQDAKAIDVAARSTQFIAAVLNGLGNVDPQKVLGRGVIPEIGTPLIDNVVTVPGELDIESEASDYASFIKPFMDSKK